MAENNVPVFEGFDEAEINAVKEKLNAADIASAIEKIHLEGDIIKIFVDIRDEPKAFAVIDEFLQKY